MGLWQMADSLKCHSEVTAKEEGGVVCQDTENMAWRRRVMKTDSISTSPAVRLKQVAHPQNLLNAPHLSENARPAQRRSDARCIF